MSQIIQDLKWRYAVKKFDNTKKLPEEKINLLKEAFNLTPTSFGLQPIKLVVVTNDNLKKQLQEFAYNQVQVSTCSHLLIICRQTDFGDKDIERFIELNIQVMPEKKEYFIEYGKILKKRFANKTASEISQWASDQAFIALGNLTTVCAVEKIDSCPMTGFEPDKFNEILNLKDFGLSAVALLPVGYRAKDDKHQFDPKIRKPQAEVVIEIN